jgi:hypothetical protein
LEVYENLNPAIFCFLSSLSLHIDFQFATKFIWKA